MQKKSGYILLAVLCILSAAFALYAGEVYLLVATEMKGRAPGAVTTRDDRHAIEVVRDLRAQGQAAFPYANFRTDVLQQGPNGDFVSRFSENNAEFAPLGHISHALTVFCNEGGNWETYESDRHGFHNPDDVWTASPIRILAIGDSFTHGVCAPPGRHMVDLIRDEYKSVVNLGRMGSGPLFQLATLKEYGAALRPSVVLWFFMEDNDIVGDLYDERRSPLLAKYLENPGFNQRLLERQDEIDPLLKKRSDILVDEILAKLKTKRETESGLTANAAPNFDWAALKDKAEQTSSLTLVRGVLGLNWVGGKKKERLDSLYDSYRSIVKEAKRFAGAWGGKIYVVYLPDAHRYINFRQRLVKDEQRERVEDILSAEGIELIDLIPAFTDHADKASLFWSHYTPEGYKLVADVVLQRLKSDGLSP